MNASANHAKPVGEMTMEELLEICSKTLPDHKHDCPATAWLGCNCKAGVERVRKEDAAEVIAHRFKNSPPTVLRALQETLDWLHHDDDCKNSHGGECDCGCDDVWDSVCKAINALNGKEVA